jgi:hypothetical protein
MGPRNRLLFERGSALRAEIRAILSAAPLTAKHIRTRRARDGIANTRMRRFAGAPHPFNDLVQNDARVFVESLLRGARI